jgi:biopolymer transport protein ExbB
MMRLGFLLAMSFCVVCSTASAQTLDELARMVRDAASSEAKINQEREAEFVRERNNQGNLLAEARQELADENTRSDHLREEYDQNERAFWRGPSVFG